MSIVNRKELLVSPMNEHLHLLRAEYLRLQKEYAELKKEYDVLVASQDASKIKPKTALSFVQKLVTMVADLFDKDLYSDITIHCDGHQLCAHKFVIASRTSYWDDLSLLDRIEFKDLTYSVAYIVIKWMYTDELEGHLGDSLLIQVLSAANKYEMKDLQKRCELILIGRLDASNCVKLYQISEEKNLERLKNACSQLFSIRWNEFTPDLFVDMPAPLLYRILKSYCKFLLHSIISVRRGDVLFLFFVDSSEKFMELCNQYDEADHLPLDIALSSNDFEIASSLIAHGADINVIDKNGKSFLVKAVEQGRIDSCEFITAHGGRCDFTLPNTGESVLHILAKEKCSDRMISWFSDRISLFDVNAVDLKLSSPLLTAVDAGNQKVIEFLLSTSSINPNLSDAYGRTPLSVALFDKKDFTLANILVNHGSDVEVKFNGKRLIHYALQEENLAALQFLCKKNAKLNLPDTEGMFVLHLAAQHPVFNEDLFRILLKFGADVTLKSGKNGSTIFHYAVDCMHGERVLGTILNEQHGRKLSLSLKDNNGQSPLAKAVLGNKFNCANVLIGAGADVNELQDHRTLLLTALLAGNDRAAVFLLDNGADASIGSADGKSCLHIAVELGLLSAVRCLCKSGADLNARNPVTGFPPLWTALENEAYDVAYILVEHGCDLEYLIDNTEKCCRESMLYRAIENRLADAAVFLIENGCDVNSMRKYMKRTFDDLRTPLQACLETDLEEVAITLIKNGAKIDVQDADGRTPAHVAVQKKYNRVLEVILEESDVSFLLLRDRYGASPLVAAMQARNIVAAEAIVTAVPYTIIQFNGNGENLLHNMVRNADFESVLFLLALHFDVNVATQNASRMTPLHLCAQSGNELIMRNLILAGADVNAISAKGFTPLHVAAYHNRGELCSVLLDNGASARILDRDGNNALHAAVLQGSVEAVKLLLKESDVDPRAVNKKQQTPLSLVASGTSPSSSLEILRAFLNTDPSYPVDSRDFNGNTLFLLGYMNGNAELCKSLLRCDICFAVTNNYGVSVFSFETPTKQLLFSLLDSLGKEPKWAEGEVCSECEARFSLTIRKHHCRHCGRLVCAKCSEHSIPILKYDLQKAVRVCQICSDVLTIGVQ